MARIAGSVGVETATKVKVVALNLFAQRGYAAVSMREIADGAGIQAGAIYNHFKGKQQLLSNLLVGHMEQLLNAAETHKFPEIEPSAALEQFVRFHIRYHIDKADEVFIAYMELRSLEPENFAEVQRLRQRYERILRDILRRGQKAGAVDIADVPVSAMAVLSMLTGVNTWFRYGGRLSVGEIEEIFVDLVMRSVGVRSDHSVDKAMRNIA